MVNKDLLKYFVDWAPINIIPLLHYHIFINQQCNIYKCYFTYINFIKYESFSNVNYRKLVKSNFDYKHKELKKNNLHKY